jgi:tetratricopeptide (TPR) repeat protein
VEASYSELMKKGEAALEGNGLGSVTAESAASAFFQQAARAAPDDDKKYQALVRAAEVAVQIKDFRGASELYNVARALPKITPAQKASAQFGYASSRHQDAKANNKPLDLVVPIQAEYEAALRVPQLPARLRIQAHEAVGDLLILRGQRLAAVREYQKILALPVAKNDSVRRFYLNRIFAELQKLAPAPEAVALADNAFKQYLPLQETPEAAVAVREEFAQILVAQNQMPRAIAMWNEIADDKTLPLNARADALRKIGASQRSAGNWAEALRAADRLSTLSGVTPQSAPVLAAWRGWDRAGVFLAQGDEAKARTEWEAMIASPQISAEEKGRVWMEVAASYARAAKAKPDNAALIEAEKKAYESAWKLEGAAPAIRAQAVLNRGQIELDAKNSAAAVTLLQSAFSEVDTWKATPEASADIKREILFATAKIQRGDKNFNAAIATLVQAQAFNKKNDPKLMQTAIAISQDAFAAKQWDAVRSALAALKDNWGFSGKVYLLNMAEVDVAQEKWADAKKSLDEAAALKPTPGEQATIDRLRAKLPAGT